MLETLNGKSKVGDLTLQLRQKGNWTEKGSLVRPTEFDQEVNRAQERQFEQSIKQNQELTLHRGYSKDEK